MRIKIQMKLEIESAYKTPFLPFTSKKIDDMINKKTIEWKYVQKTDKIKYVDHLFLRIDPKQIEREKKQLGLSC
ncbi:MAG: hypothetical protein ACLFMO_05245 [Eubacteriales bacterium]